MSDSAGYLGATPEAGALHLQLIGAVKLRGTLPHSVEQPQLRKAMAILAVLALTEGHAMTRRELARLLWSRNTLGQSLARLRDTLHRLRQGLEAMLPGIDVLQLVGDRVILQRNAVAIDLLDTQHIAGLSAFGPQDIARDLDEIDPHLDEWLSSMRSRLKPGLPRGTPLQPRKRHGPGIGVRPMRVIGEGIEAYLPAALAGEITSALARVRWLAVASSASLAAMLASGGNAFADLGLDFILEGTLQKIGDRIRVSIALVDAELGAILWNWCREFDSFDLLALQEDVAAMVVATVEPEISIVEAERVRRSGAASKGAYGLVLQAASVMFRLDHDVFLEGGRLINEAIACDPNYGAAHAWLALWNILLVGQGWAEKPQVSIEAAGAAAERAITLDPGDARGLAVAGHVQAFLYRKLDRAFALHERAVAINPGLPIAWQFGGLAHTYAGNLAEARRYLARSQRLAPVDLHCFFQDGCQLLIELLSGNFKLAAAIGQRVTQLHPRCSAAFKPYLAALGHLGDPAEAAEIHQKLLDLEQGFSVQAFLAAAPFAKPRHLDLYVAGLRRAGVR